MGGPCLGTGPADLSSGRSGSGGDFSTLTDAERQLLETAVTLKQGAKGEQIIFQDTAMKQMVILLDGHASVRVNGKQVAELFGEILLGEIEFLDGPAASADVFLLPIPTILLWTMPC